MNILFAINKVFQIILKQHPMLGLKTILSAFFLFVLACSIAVNNRDSFLIDSNHSHVINFKLQHSSRITFVLYHGTASFKIKVEDEIIFHDNPTITQIELKQEYKDKDISLEVNHGPAIGMILRQSIQTYELVSPGQQKMIELQQRQSRIIEIHPRKYTVLKIQKFEGIATFTNNRCLLSQKQDCFYELQRLDPNRMTKNIQIVHFDSCVHCLVLIKVESNTPKTILRMSISSELHIISGMSTVALLKKGQKTTFIIHGQPNTQGKIMKYSGSISIDSPLVCTQFSNGYFYQIPANHNYSKPIEITLEGEGGFSYVMIEGPTQQNPLNMQDGLPESFQIKPNVTYIARLDKRGQGRGNFVLAGDSSFLNQLYIRFINKELNLHYAVKPQFLFEVGQASQNFQLDNSTGVIELEIKSMGKDSGFLNASASLSETMNLPLNWKQSNILEHRQTNSYIIDGINGTIQVIIQKCVECNLQIGFGTEPEAMKQEIIQSRILNKTFEIKEGHLYVRLSTNNYAFYSILVKNSSDLNPQVEMQKLKVQTYITNPDEQLQLEFIGPKCGQKYCSNKKYYLVEGSDKRHVTSRAYCPNALFDFDQRTKDIVFEEIHPKQINESHLSYMRPFKHREWLVIAAKVGDQIFSYDLINSGQIREYNSIRWPIFYFVLFLTFAVFMSFVIFMALQRPKGDSMGYLRGASAVSEEQINE